MRLNFVELRNYRKFAHVELELSDGIVGILGANGVGKSTLVESVAWAMFGNQKEIVRTDKESVRRVGAPPREPTSVKIEFQFSGDEYVIERQMSGKSLVMDASVTMNGKLLATGASEVTSFIERRLGMDYKSFFISVFAKQKDLNALSSLSERDRRITVVRMLGIDRLDEIISEISREERAQRDMTKNLSSLIVSEDGQPKERLLSENIAELNGKKDVLRVDIEKLRSRQERLRADVNAHDARAADISDRLRTLRDAARKKEGKTALLHSKLKNREKLRREVDQASKAAEMTEQLTPMNEQSEALKKEREELVSLKLQSERLDEKRKKLEPLEREIGSTESELVRIREALGELEGMKRALEEVSEESAETEDELSSLRDEHAELRERLSSSKDALAVDEGHLRQIDELGPDSACPTCERLLGDHHRQLSEKLRATVDRKRRELANLEERLRETGSRIEKGARKLEAIRRKQEELREREKELARIERELQMLEGDLRTLSESRTSLQLEISELGDIRFDLGRLNAVVEELTELERRREKLIALAGIAERRHELQKELTALESEIEELQKEIDGIELDMTEIELLEQGEEELERERRELREESESTYERLMEKSAQSERIGAELRGLESELKAVQETKNRLVALEENLSYIAKLSEVMKEFRVHLISRITPTLSQIGGELLSRLTDGKYASLTLDEGYNIFIEDDGEMYRLERFSGGEEDLANLCLRLAISKVIAERAGSEGIDLLVLDEIFGSQDVSRKRNLMNAFSSLARQFRQIFLITHIDDIKEFMTDLIEVYEDETGTSHLRRVE